MIDIKFVLAHPERYDQGMVDRGLRPVSGKIIELDNKRRAALTEVERTRAELNEISKKIGKIKALESDLNKIDQKIAANEHKIIQRLRSVKNLYNMLNSIINPFTQ